MNSSDSVASLFMLLVSCGAFVGMIALAVFLVKRSGDITKQSETNINRIVTQLPSDKQMIFMMQYNNVKKSPTTALLLDLFLGGIGGHKFYMGQTGMGILYLLFCWTFIPGLIAFVELFTISGSVAKYNEQKAYESAMMFGAVVR